MESAPSKIVKSPLLRAFVDIWCGARTGGADIPAKSAIDPVDLGRAGLMPYTWLVEREQSGRFKYRVSGSEVDAVYCCSVTGRYADEILTPETRDMITRLWSRILDERLGFHSLGNLTVSGVLPIAGERLSLPLTDDKGTPRYIFGITEYVFDRGSLIERTGKRDYEWVSRDIFPAATIKPFAI